MDERREYRRITKSFMSWLRLIPCARKNRQPVAWDIVTTRDLSAGGMLFSYDRQIDIGIGARFRVIFPFADHLIECAGEIIRDEKIDSFKYPSMHHIAVRFGRISTVNKKFVNKTVNLIYMWQNERLWQDASEGNIA
jgi:hypothetical protein